eukprot:CAMPEP_0204595528 /NCGR_PEP_ID=MMETSP0661-20131031/52721_1 /ASSEMBLY_ACC=CAM_ASM_000606 /TAXON_ID=109239 /ORGANISM="Alexandrium margalefi, Strain AMGDE01CS-322" /LENGTH=565 /DNA_ID=CAMNT_0051606061 /DNA_START=45 /DNA_END=1742 /DNA_ORIENTATION=-
MRARLRADSDQDALRRPTMSIRWLFQLALLCAARSAGASKRVHYWPNVRGNVGSYGVSDVKVPPNFNGGKLAWKWTHPDGQYGSTVVGGPVIDYEKNLYFVEVGGVYKMTVDGKLLWKVEPRKRGCFFPDGPSLLGDSLFVTTTCGELCSLDIATGKYNWKEVCRQYFPTTGGDSKYITSHDGVVFIGTDDAGGGGSKHVVGVNATDGEMLWSFKPDVPTWNNMGQYPGDGTIIFQDWDSRAYRLSNSNGSLVWKSGGRSLSRYEHPPYAETWTDGGLLLGADNVAYAVSSKVGQSRSSEAWGGGGVHAHRVSDGKLLWEADVDHQILTWPVSAQIDGDESFTVFAFPSAGAPKNCMVWEFVMTGAMLQFASTIIPRAVLTGVAAFGAMALITRKGGGTRRVIRKLLLGAFLGALAGCACAVFAAVYYQRDIVAWYTSGATPSEVVALDGATGLRKWQHTFMTWTNPTAKGDQEGLWQRFWSQPQRPICCPVAYSSPSVDGNGVVYIGHMSGKIFGVKDWDKNGRISDDEVYEFDAEGAFLHSGPAFAPGVFAFTTCEQLFVFRF